jgi:CBS domain-containing protein
MMMKVKDIMTSDPVYCTPDTNLEIVAKLMLEHDCGEIPIVDNEVDLKPIGVITDRDIVCRTVARGKNPLKILAKDSMTKPCVTITPETTIEECCRILEKKQIRRVPVVDEKGCCCGIISQADIATHHLRDQIAEVLEEVSQRR